MAFKDFVQYVKEEAELANDPIFSPDVLKKERKKNGLLKDNNRNTRPKYQGGFNPSQSLATSATPVRQSKRQQPTVTPQRRSCPVCNGSHPIEKCNTFIKATIDERLSMIREKRLCIGCFKGGHVFSECRSSQPVMSAARTTTPSYTERLEGQNHAASNSQQDTSRHAIQPSPHSHPMLLSPHFQTQQVSHRVLSSCQPPPPHAGSCQ